MIEINFKPSIRELRQFAGIWFPAFCALVAFWTWKAGAAPIWPKSILGVGVVLGLVGLIAPAVIRPVFIGLSVLTFPIGLVISNVLLFLVFALVFTPIGLIMRALGRDPMLRRFDRQASSYWIAHDPGAGGAKRYFRQF
jgi:hypothetical protein